MDSEILNNAYIKIRRGEKISRLLLALFSLLIVSSVVGIVFMIPSYLVVLFSKDEVARRLQAEESVIQKLQLSSMESNINYINKNVQLFEAGEQQRNSFSKLVIGAANSLPEGVRLVSIELKKNANGLFLITLTGKADKRENLLSYINNLNTLSDFSSINSPITNLLSESRVSFSLDLSIKPESYSYHANN